MRRRSGNVSQLRSFASVPWRGFVNVVLALTVAGAALAAQAPAAGSVQEASALEQLATKRYQERNFKDAIAAAQKALAIREAMPAKEEVAIAETLGLLGTIHYDAGELTQAAQCFERAIAIRERALGPDALPTAAALNDLAMVHLREGDSVRAEPLLERGLDIRRKRLGSESSRRRCRHEQPRRDLPDPRRLRRAKPLLEGAVAIQEPFAAKEQPPAQASLTLARFLNNLGRLSMEQEDYRAAEAPLLRSLDVREKALPPVHPDIARALNALGNVYRQRGELESGGALLCQGARHLRKGCGPRQRGGRARRQQPRRALPPQRLTSNGRVLCTCARSRYASATSAHATRRSRSRWPPSQSSISSPATPRRPSRRNAARWKSGT